MANGQNAQTAINNAACGDTIQLQAGATFNTPTNLANKNCDDGHWITVETSAIASLPPEGTRISPCYAGVANLRARPAYPCPNPQNVMAKFVNPGSQGSHNIWLNNAMKWAAGANHYRFIGLEITRPTGGGSIQDSLINMGSASKIVFDRCWIHGQDNLIPDGEVAHGLALENSTYVAIIDSYFNDFWCLAYVGNCNQAQAIYGGVRWSKAPAGYWGGYKIVNNYLEGAGENVIFGGGGGNGIDSDIEIRRNYMYKPLTWNPAHPRFDGGGTLGGKKGPVQAQNLFELKNAERVLFEGNVLENSWAGFSQVGAVIVINTTSQEGQNPLAGVLDITMRYNHGSWSSQAYQLSNIDQNACCAARWSIHDDLSDHIQWPYSNQGTHYFNQVMTGNVTASQTIHDLTLNHITEVLDSRSETSLAGFDGPDSSSPGQMYNFTWKNSILPNGDYGISQNYMEGCSTKGSEPSTSVITACFKGIVKFGANLIPWGTKQYAGKWASLGGQRPSIRIADQNAVQYVDMARGDYRLKTSSPGHHAADDGTDIGANIDLLNENICGVTTGLPCGFVAKDTSH